MKNIYKFKTALVFILLIMGRGMVANGQTPIVSTDSPNTITSTTAYAAGTIDDIGSGITERGFCYGLALNPDITGSKVFEAVTGGGAIGSYELQLSSLTNPTTYHVRAYIISGGNPYYGSDVTFTTFPATSYAYSCKATNDYLIDPNTYQFDVYIYSNNSAGSDLWLNNYQLGFEVWSVGSSAGTLTASYVSGSADAILIAGSKIPGTVNFRADMSGGAHFDMVVAGQSPTSTGVQIPYSASGPGTKIGTFQIVYHSSPGVPAPFPNVKLNIVWDNDVLGKTVIYAISPPGGTGTVVNNTSFTAHLPYLGPGLPLNNYVCNSLVWKGTGGTAWATGSNWFQNPSSISAPPASSTYAYIEKEGITNFPLVSTRTAPTCGTLEVDDGAKVTISSSGDLTVNGNVLLGTTVPSPLIIQSDATGTGSLITSGTISGTGSANVQVQTYMTGNWTSGSPGTGTIWHAVSAPVLNPSNSLFNGSLMNKWNEVTQFWDPLVLPYENMALGKGYIIAPANPGITATYAGSLNTGDQTISGLTKTGVSIWSGMNLIGNPYSSAVNWNSSINVGTNVANYAYLWNGSTYITIDRTIGGVIPAGQGFFVQVITDPGSVTIPNANRIHSTQPFYKSGKTDLLTLKVEGNGYWDQTQIRILSTASEVYNIDYDAIKLTGSSIAPQLYSYKQDVQLSINSLPTLSVYPIIQLGLEPGAIGNFTITASDFESFTNSTNFYIEDLLNGNSQDLKSKPVYNFTAQPGQPEHRFNLHFSALGIGEQETGNIKIYSNENVVYVNITSSLSGDIIIYNLLGSEVAHSAIIGNSLNKITLHVAEGYYLVKVIGNSCSRTGRVFIR